MRTRALGLLGKLDYAMDFQSRSKLAVVVLLVLGLLGTGYTVYNRYGRMPGNFAAVDIVERRAQPATGSDPMPDLDGAPSPLPESPTSQEPETSSSELVVHVAGMVKNAGVYRLGPGARVIDAIKMAGGAKDTADLDSINLAARPTDGEQIYVPKKGAEAAPPMVRDASEDPSSGATSVVPPRVRSAHAASSSHPPGKTSNPHTIININKASVSQLDSLPGVGPATAQSILAYRKAIGGFARVEDLVNVRGIGDKKFAQIKPWVVVK